jgi:hypothetical protein
MLRELALVVGLIWAWAAGAAAQQVVFEQALPIGKPERSTRLRVAATEAGGSALVLGREQVPLEVPAGASWQATSIRVRGGRSVALLTASAAGRSFGVLVSAQGGRTKLLFSGELSLHGDPGERTGRRVELADRDGDGLPELVLGRFQEGVGLCGQPPALFDAQQLDPASGALTPAPLDAMAFGPVGSAGLQAAATSPGPTGAPLLRALRAVASSRRAGELDSGLSEAPRALVDGQAATAWLGEPGAGGRSQFVTLRWEASAWPVRALAVVAAPAVVPPSTLGSTAAASGPTAPERLWLVADGKPPLAVELPRALTVQPGVPLWIALPEPWSGSCLSVVLEGQPSGSGAALGLAEVIAYSELDFAGGTQALVDELIGDGKRAADAAEALAQAETSSAAALLAAWPKLSPAAKARAQRVFAGQARRDPKAVEGLERALRQATEDSVRQQLLAALLAAGPAGLQRLRAVVAEPGAVGDAAADALARSRPAEGSDALLNALDRDAGSERAALRGALALAGRDATAAARMTEFFGQPHAANVEAAAALGLAAEAATRPLALSLVLRNLARAEAFEDLWRLVLAAEDLPESRELDGWLEVLGKTDERWMLRERALATLAQRDPARAERLSRELLDDAYPRVRATALRVLGTNPDSGELLALRARRDRWPLVRAAALDAMGGEPAKPLLRAALTDRSRAVRTAALRGLTRVQDRSAEQQVLGRLTDTEEWPEVQAEAVDYVQALCVQAGADGLLEVAQRGLAPNAWDPHVELAMRALQAMGRLGGKPAATARALAGAQPGGVKLAESLDRAVESAGKCPPPR